MLPPLTHWLTKPRKKLTIRCLGLFLMPKRDGGSIPIVPMFEDVLKTKTLLMGFGYDSDAIHAPNEHYGVDNFLLGIETIAHFHRHFSKLSAQE